MCKGASTASKSPPHSPAGGAGKDSKEEANTTIIDSEGRKTTDAYDEDLQRTDVPGYIRVLAPYIDTFNWATNYVMYTLAPLCKCRVKGGWGGVVRSFVRDGSSRMVVPVSRR